MTTRRRTFLAAAAVAPAAALFQACGGGGSSGSGGSVTPPPSGSSTLLSQVQNDGSLSLLLAALQKAGLTATLDDGSASLTLFAPDDTAFDAEGARLGFGNGTGLIDALSADQWNRILRFHMLPQALSLATLTSYGTLGGTRPATLYSFEGNPMPLIFDTSTGPLNIWDGVGRTSITVRRGDIGASNGVMHVVSDPLLPRGVLSLLQGLRANSDFFSEFASSAGASNMAGPLDDLGQVFTVFVPSDARTNAAGLSSTQVRRHIVSGRIDGDSFSDGLSVQPLSGGALTLERTTVNGVVTYYLRSGGVRVAQIIDVDFWAGNGVIHVIDSVIP